MANVRNRDLSPGAEFCPVNTAMEIIMIRLLKEPDHRKYYTLKDPV